VLRFQRRFATINRIQWTLDDEREKLALETIGIGNSPLLFLP
jgi:hypothetical protein